MEKSASTLLFSILCMCTPVCNVAMGDEIYKWIDPKGVTHITNDPSNLPDGNEQIEKISLDELNPDGAQDPSLYENDQESVISTEEQELNDISEEQKLREEEGKKLYWRGLALELKNREDYIKGEMEYTVILRREKKREVDWFLTNGYAADYLILDLRYLEDKLKDLNTKLASIEKEKELLSTDARKAGVSPGYLRP